MKFSCEKALLQSAIAVTSRAVAAKSSIPALEGLLLRADGAVEAAWWPHNLPATTCRPASAPRSPPM